MLLWAISALQKGARSGQAATGDGTAAISDSGDGPELGGLQHPAVAPSLDSQLCALSTTLKILLEVSRAISASNGNGGSVGCVAVQPSVGIALGWRRCGLLRGGLLRDFSQALVPFMAALCDDPPLERSLEGVDDDGGVGGSSGVEDVSEARLMCCRVWRGIASILDLDLDQGIDLNGSQEGAHAGGGLRPGLLLDAARYLVRWALKVRPSICPPV